VEALQALQDKVRQHIALYSTGLQYCCTFQIILESTAAKSQI
jgi:hypothetical protein